VTGSIITLTIFASPLAQLLQDRKISDPLNHHWQTRVFRETQNSSHDLFALAMYCIDPFAPDAASGWDPQRQPQEARLG
jgi:hypothetical protein